MLLRACVLLALVHVASITSSAEAQWVGEVATTVVSIGGPRGLRGPHGHGQRIVSTAGDVWPGHSSLNNSVRAKVPKKSNPAWARHTKTCSAFGAGIPCTFNRESDRAGPQPRRGGVLELRKENRTWTSSAEPHAE